MPSPIIEAKNNLEILLQQYHIPVLVDFWAPWCSPCQQLNPVLEEVAHRLQGELQIIKVNVDDNEEAVSLYHIQKIPTLLVLDEKKNIVHTARGYRTLQELLATLQELPIW